MKSLCLSIALMLGCVHVLAQDSTLIGRYDVAGTNNEGVQYTGTVEIRETDGVFRLHWLTGGRTVAIGAGMIDGTTLSVVFQTEGGAIGLVSYRIDGTTLVGRWILPGQPGIYPETLTRADPRLHGAEKGPKQQL